LGWAGLRTIATNIAALLFIQCKVGIQCITKMKSLGSFEEQVLMAIYYSGDRAYGGQVTEAIEEATGSEVSVGAVYATLERLLTKKLITWEYGIDETESGKPKKMWSLSDEGRTSLQRMEVIRTNLQGLRTVKA
jgi:PadR family transcriptional regulator, regulatory protein PadR